MLSNNRLLRAELLELHKIAGCQATQATYNGAMQRYVSPNLSHFVGRSLQNDDARYQLLLLILRNGILLDPRYARRRANPIFFFDVENSTATARENFYPVPNFEVKPHASVDTNEFVAPETVCFCDIPPDELSIHTTQYSRFGVSFRKEFLISQGANPVWYVARTAPVDMALVSEGDFRDFFAGELRYDNRGTFLNTMRDLLLRYDQREGAASGRDDSL